MSSGNPDESRSKVLRAAGVMGFATFLSRIAGLVREQALAFLFGAGHATDAFGVAFRIPNLLRDLFAEGAMSASLVPVFTRARIEQGELRAWRVAGLVFRALAVLVGGIAVLGILFAPQLAHWYASAFESVPGKMELTVRMTQIMFPFFPLVALAAAFMGILNACGIFFLPAFSSALFNFTSICVGVACTWFFSGPGKDLGFSPIEGWAFGVVAGGLVQAFSQLPALYRAGYRWPEKEASDPVWYRDPALRKMMVMMLPGTIGLAATQVNLFVNTVLATSQEPGAVSWLNYAFRLMYFPIGVFGLSLATATLPRVSQQWVEKDFGRVQTTLAQSLKSVFAINLPASAGLVFLGVPIIELIYQYGQFTEASTHHTAMALAMYAVGLTAYSSVKVLVPACYAFGNTRIPVIASLVSVGATIGFNLLMIKPLGYQGLALGMSLGAVVNALLLLFATRSLLQGVGGGFPVLPLAKSFLVHLGIALAMGGLCSRTSQWLDRWDMLSLFEPMIGKLSVPLTRALKIGLLVSEGVAFVLILAHLLRIPETTEVTDLFTKKLKKKLSRSPR